MADQGPLWNVTPPRATPRPAEPLWTLRRGSDLTEVVLRYHGEYGVEAQCFRRGTLLYGRRFDLRAQALEWAESERLVLERDGWQLVES